MLQYSVLYCNRLQEAKLYRNTKLYCDSGLGGWASGWRARRAGACRWQRGAAGAGRAGVSGRAGAGGRAGGRRAGAS